jgi:Tfp pilus assembly protein PilX
MMINFFSIDTPTPMIGLYAGFGVGAVILMIILVVVVILTVAVVVIFVTKRRVKGYMY